MGYHIVRDSEDHMEVLSNKEYKNRQSGKGCLTVLLLAIIIGSLFYFQEDEESAKTKTEIVSEKSQSVETEQPTEPRVVIEDENPTITFENVEQNVEENVKEIVKQNEGENVEENVEDDVSSRKEEKSISIDELVNRYQNNQDQ
ncbi:MAG: hypothetical protein IJ897_04830 [Prevotella sp.]|nr:hypothetical protein [Prevotella sp.]